MTEPNSAALECRRFGTEHVESALAMLLAVSSEPTGAFFTPHPFTREALSQIATHPGLDLYYALSKGSSVLAYGMLRGWNEGFEVPSLGIAVGAEYRGKGYGRLLMSFLHAAAAERSAARVRLRVHVQNERAISLYESMNYEFERGVDAAGLRVAFVNLSPDRR